MKSARSQAAKKAWQTRHRLATFGKARATEASPSQAAKKAWQTRRRLGAFEKARAAEAASKEALRAYCEKHGWRVAFFEGPTGAPRTGIIDAIVFRIDKKNPDRLDLRLIQLKGGGAGVSGRETARLKHAAADVTVHWTIAMYDDNTLHFLPDL